MKNTHSQIETSHRSAFDELLKQPVNLTTEFVKLPFWQRVLSKFELLAYIFAPQLKPNCLLLRFPLTLIFSQPWYKTSIIDQLAARWLIWQLQRHGYNVSCKRVYGDARGSRQKTSSHLLYLGREELKEDFTDVSKHLAPLSVTWMEGSHIDFQPARPLTSLSSLLVWVNLLAEQDHR